MIFSVYLVTCTSVRKYYVGVTTRSIAVRFREHLRASGECAALSTAVLKYGKSAFSVALLSRSSSQRKACLMEKRYIQEYNSQVPHGFNLSLGGLRDFTVTAVTRLKMSRRMKKLYASEQARKRQSTATRNGITAAAKKTRSARLTMLWRDPAFREKMTAVRRLGKSRAQHGRMMRKLWSTAAWRRTQLRHSQYAKAPQAYLRGGKG